MLTFSLSWGGILLNLEALGFDCLPMVLRVRPQASFAQNLPWQAVFAAMLWLLVALVLTRDLTLRRGSEAR